MHINTIQFAPLTTQGKNAKVMKNNVCIVEELAIEVTIVTKNNSIAHSRQKVQLS